MLVAFIKSMPTSVKKITVYLLLALALSSAGVFALTVQEQANFFVNSGETASAVQAGAYYVVLVNGVETAVLKPVGNDFTIVQSQGEFTVAVQAYSQNVFQNDLKPAVPGIESTFDSLKGIVDTCLKGSKWFSFNATRGGVYVAYNVRYDPFHWPKEWGAIHYIEDNVYAFEDSWNSAKAGMESLASSLSDAEVALAATANAREGLKPIRAQYPKYYEAFLNATSSNQYAYSIQAKPYPCAPDSEVSGKIDSILSAIGASKFNPPSYLVSLISNKTAERFGQATQTKQNATQSIRASELVQSAQTLNANFSSLGVTLDKFQSDLTDLQNSVGTNSFENQTAVFSARLEKYQGLYVQYNATLFSLNRAQGALTNASNRYGGSDDRVSDLKRRLDQANVELRESQSLLKTGKLEVLNLPGLNENATSIAVTAENLQPKENQFDLVTIGVVILVLALLVGGFLYLRKRQPPQAERPRIFGGNSDEIEQMDFGSENPRG